jgi:2-polyprenyl-3-methyl-5-hydroxy-6-metoxy-1,4-benzoquinol methylase
MDLNKTCLKIAAKRLSRYRPEIYQRNILEPLDIDTTKFDSIGILNVLHCLPGDMEHKATAFENIKSMLNPGGVVFGSTILGKGISNSITATLALTVSNVIGTMSNRGDDLEGLQINLSKHFSESRIDLVGNEAIFRAKLPII